MPLPLPNLDTRRWGDLVEEGRALIPRYAPAWTDHNVHDPGITVMELLAWLVEQEIYRANRVPESHRRKFLALAGFPVEPPRPARLALAFSSAAAIDLPEGFTVATEDASGESLSFRLTEPLSVLPAAIGAVQSFDGSAFSDRTRAWQTGVPFHAWGADPSAAEDPEASPALYIGFDQALPAGSELRLWLAFAGGRSGWEWRDRLEQELAVQAGLCLPPGPANLPDCGEQPPEEAGQAPPSIEHPSLRAVWEYLDGAAWRPVDAEDGTRSLTLDGPVAVTVPAGMAQSTLGLIEDEGLWYLRCRLAEGRPDVAPLVAGLITNAGVAQQATPARSTFPIARGVTPPAGQEPVPGQTQRLRLRLDPFGTVTELAALAAGPWPEALVLDYRPATADRPGALTCSLVFVEQATGLPGQEVDLPEAPVAGGRSRLWTLSSAGAEEWQAVPDLDASAPTALEFALEPRSGAARFGDGVRGRLPASGAAIVAAYPLTAGRDGNVGRTARFRTAGADDLLNAALGVDPVPADLAVTGALAVRPGATDEVASAAGRTAEVLWAHERLLELATRGRSTLDQAVRDEVLRRRAPSRATTLLDYERLALDVPGTGVLRARAWTGIDPRYPCLSAPGTVSVVVVPELPLGRPEPSGELLEAVRRYLNRRRTIGTRLVVTGPEYVEVRVQARVRALPRADAARTQADVVAALEEFLDPMRGGPEGRGWPFGRDVYRSEVLEVIDRVPGVDHVLSLELFAGAEQVTCGNVCIGPFALAASGPHEVEVV